MALQNVLYRQNALTMYLTVAISTSCLEEDDSEHYSIVFYKFFYSQCNWIKMKVPEKEKNEQNVQFSLFC